MRILAGLALLAAAHTAVAQLHLPQVPLQVPQAPLQVPRVPPPSDLTTVPATIVRNAQGVLDPGNLLDTRRAAIRDQLRQHPEVLDSDPAGELIVRK